MTDTLFDSLLICSTCGTQYDQPASEPLSTCKICMDQRQYVPASGQAWSSLAELREGHSNVIEQIDASIWSIRSEPKIGIGQRCFFISTQAGNILWDCITLLDEQTTAFITLKGGIDGIVISHPHFYSTHLYWAEVFECPVYLAAEDEQWCAMPDSGTRRFIQGLSQEIIPGIQAIKLGGHFPGSMVLRFDNDSDAHLFLADTIMVVPSSMTPDPRAAGTTTFSFMWSYPNMIPLSPAELARMWNELKKYNFNHVHGGFPGQDLSRKDVKSRVLESMQIQARAMGWTHETADILEETM